MNNLHPIAQAVQSQGRGKDTQLVHMTPNEVQGLHALAKAHGGSLSVNPSTGLPEAGFLDSMLPTILGVGITAATGGAAAPWMIGAGIGGLQYMRTGSLEKGLMAGLGAYGGAGLGTSLMGAGASNVVGSQASKIAGENALMQEAAKKAATDTAMDTARQATFQTAADTSAKELLAAQSQAAASNTFGQNLSNMGGGLKNAFTDPTTFMKNYGGSGMDLAQYGGAALSTPLMDSMAPAAGPGYTPDNEQFQYDYNPNRATQEQIDAQRAAYAARGITGGELKYFNPTYAGPNKTYVAKGGLLSLAEGGMPNDYEYDPVSQTYKKVVQAPTAAVAPIGVPNAPQESVGREEGGDATVGLTPQQEAFLDAEAAIPNARDARMGKINDALTQLSKMSITGAIARGVTEAMSTPTAPNPGGYTPPAPAQYSGGPNSFDGSGPEATGHDAGITGTNSFSAPDGDGYNEAAGGLISLAAGGMSQGGFVVPADVVSALGNGSSDAGLRKLYALIGDVKPIKGNGDGLSDSIPTSIDGRQPARVADGEAYVNPKTVAKIGGGDAKKGAKKLYAMMDKIRQQAHGKKTQQRKVNAKAVV
jgi:hypothetical protein